MMRLLWLCFWAVVVELFVLAGVLGCLALRDTPGWVWLRYKGKRALWLLGLIECREWDDQVQKKYEDRRGGPSRPA